jgi:hypothetical protein
MFLDRVIRRSYVSLSTDPWHGTRRLVSPPVPEQLGGVDVVHLHVVADWFDVPRWLETLPRRIGIVIGLHGMWHVTGGCFLYRGCNRYSTFRVGGIPDASPDGKVALLCEPLDAFSFLGATQCLRSSPKVHEKLANSASDLAASRNNNREFVAEFVNVYRHCLHFVRTPGAETPAIAT